MVYNRSNARPLVYSIGQMNMVRWGQNLKIPQTKTQYLGMRDRCYVFILQTTKTPW